MFIFVHMSEIGGHFWIVTLYGYQASAHAVLRFDTGQLHGLRQTAQGLGGVNVHCSQRIIKRSWPLTSTNHVEP